MKNNRILSIIGLIFIVGVFALFCFVTPIRAATVTNLVDFNNTSDLTNLFNPSTDHTFTNIGDSGISDSGSINVPDGSSDIWTTKQGYSVSGTGDKYTLSAFFKNKASSGYGGLGFSNAATNNSVPIDVGYGNTITPAKGIDVIFHGSGGAFVNNASVAQTLDWSGTDGDLIEGNWYKMIFVVTAKGSNTYDLDLQIWNSDANGNLGTLFTQQSQNGIVNADMGSSSIIHGYFSADARRMEKIDNFLIQLEGGASFIEAGLPVVLTDPITSITSNSATSGGNVTDGQGQDVVSRGVCWSTSPSPILNDSRVIVGSGLGAFTGNLTGLTPSTTYYVRAYAFNSLGTSYGSEYSFTTDANLTPTPTVASNQNNNDSSNSSSSPSAPSCGDNKPFGSPDLFQIDVNDTHATLYYTPLNNNNNDYFISFSEISNTFRYGTLTGQGPSSGVLSYTINFLQPNATYYFKVRGQNGCMPGDWSNEMKVMTKAKGTTGKTLYYKNSPVIKLSFTPYSVVSTKKMVLGVSTNEPSPIDSPKPSIVPKQENNTTPTQTNKKCLLFWCW